MIGDIIEHLEQNKNINNNIIIYNIFVNARSNLNSEPSSIYNITNPQSILWNEINQLWESDYLIDAIRPYVNY